VYDGRGDSVVDIEKPDGDAALLYVKGNAGSRYFGVTGFDDDGNRTDGYVNAVDPYEGITPLDFSASGKATTRLQVEATGDWHIEVRSVRTARLLAVPGRSDGTGDEVVVIVAAADKVHVEGNPQGRYFGIRAVPLEGGFPDLIVNTTDRYSGDTIVPHDVRVFIVQAQGAWSLDFTAA